MSGLNQVVVTLKNQKGEQRKVVVTKAMVVDYMEDTIYGLLSDQVCNCEPTGETNVIECGCEDYVDEFEIVADEN